MCVFCIENVPLLFSLVAWTFQNSKGMCLWSCVHLCLCVPECSFTRETHDWYISVFQRMIMILHMCVYVVGDHSTTAWGESVFNMPLCGLISKFTKVCVSVFVCLFWCTFGCVCVFPWVGPRALVDVSLLAASIHQLYSHNNNKALLLPRCSPQNTHIRKRTHTDTHTNKSCLPQLPPPTATTS